MKTTGHVFALTRVKAIASDSLIQGTCFIQGHPLVVLYDSGATHSFISYACVEKLKLSVSRLPTNLSVEIPSDKTVITSHAYLEWTVVIDGESFVVDLICLPLLGLDVILGMDWLHANRVF